MDAVTYIWVNGKKHYYRDNRKQIQAFCRLGRILGITGDKKNAKRDFRKGVTKHIIWLKDVKSRVEKSLETGEIRFR